MAATFDPNNPHRCLRPIVVDMRQNLVATTPGLFRSNVSLATTVASEGWQITGIQPLQTPVFPVTCRELQATLLSLTLGLDYPTQVGPIKKLNPHSNATNHAYFDTSAFASNLISCGR